MRAISERLPHLMCLQLLRDALRLRKQVKVIRPARLRIRPAHVESAKRMRSHHRARALAIQIEIAHVKLPRRVVQLRGV